jgi:hypothetical protein
MPASDIAITSAGTKIYISMAKPTAQTSTAYAALTWEEIGDVDDIGEHGAETSTIKRTPLASRIVRKLKGSTDYGMLPLKLARVFGDAGQDDCITMQGDDNAAAFKIEYSDGTKAYFEALVMSFKTGVGGAESFTSASINLELDSAIVEVLPA